MTCSHWPNSPLKFSSTFPLDLPSPQNPLILCFSRAGFNLPSLLQESSMKSSLYNCVQCNFSMTNVYSFLVIQKCLQFYVMFLLIFLPENQWSFIHSLTMYKVAGNIKIKVLTRIRHGVNKSKVCIRDIWAIR